MLFIWNVALNVDVAGSVEIGRLTATAVVLDASDIIQFSDRKTFYFTFSENQMV